MKYLFSKLAFVSLWVGAVTYLNWYMNGQSLIGVDDANIYMVYMRNLAEGHGLVFNVGGERVEGFYIAALDARW